MMSRKPLDAMVKTTCAPCIANWDWLRWLSGNLFFISSVRSTFSFMHMVMLPNRTYAHQVRKKNNPPPFPLYSSGVEGTHVPEDAYEVLREEQQKMDEHCPRQPENGVICREVIIRTTIDRNELAATLVGIGQIGRHLVLFIHETRKTRVSLNCSSPG